MHFRFSCPHTSSQNGKAERKIKSINNIIWTMLAHSSMPPSFLASCSWNGNLSIKYSSFKIIKLYHSPTQILYNKIPDYSHLLVLGCLCYALFPSTTINKLQARSTPCVFLGYPSNHRGYKCYDLSQKKNITSRHVIFDESQFPFSKIHTPSSSSYEFLDDSIHPSILHQLAHSPSPPTDQSTPTHSTLLAHLIIFSKPPP